MKFYLILFLTLTSGVIFSQTSNISGKITSEEDVPVLYANLTLQELSILIVSDSEGRFNFRSIPYGEYHITITHDGFLNKSMKINLTANDLALDIMLKKSLIETPTIDVTGSFTPIDISNSTFSVTSISARILSRIRGENIASTIQNIPGINNLSTGNSIGKPVIRGLTSQSVLVVKNGVKHESQQWGDEHAPEISLFDLDRIEILRGPASLMYGADGIGGVINIISKPLQFSSKKNPITYGNIDLNGYSMNSEGAGNLMLGLGTRSFGIKGFAGYRKGGNIKTPEGELMVNTPEGIATLTGGELFNSDNIEFEAGAEFGFKGKFGIINAQYQNFNRELQLHDDPSEDPNATPNQNILTNHFEATSTLYINKNIQLEPVLSYETQSRIEYESIEDKENDVRSLNLFLKSFIADIKLDHSLTKVINGAVGLSFETQTNQSTGEEKLIPNYNSNNFGVYLMEKMDRKFYSISLGGRFDTKNEYIKETVFETDEEGKPVTVISPNHLNFNSFSGSAGFVYKPNEDVDIFTNLGSGWRPPSEFDLYADGVHEGTGRYDIGLIVQDPALNPDPERSVNFDLGTRIRTKYVSAELSFYRNQVNNFIYPSPTGETDSASGLPIYDIRQASSSFTGYEYNIQVQPFEWTVLSFTGDYVRTKNEETQNSLPFTPPAKNIITVKFQKNNFGSLYNPYINFSTKIVSAQNDVDPLEGSSEGYTLLGTGLGFDFVLSRAIASVDFSVSNLGNLKYTDHLSRYRYYAMAPGRSYNLKFTIPFQF
ncbi:MAG: TonB-dependent receptor [Ignavibacteria bacterium]|nr:TonB-dependent receptor [Ignavibacteria bacterium]